MPATCHPAHRVAEALEDGLAVLVPCPCRCDDQFDAHPDCWVCLGEGEAVRMPDGTLNPAPADADDPYAHSDDCRCPNCDPDWHADLAAGI